MLQTVQSIAMTGIKFVGTIARTGGVIIGSSEIIKGQAKLIQAKDRHDVQEGIVTMLIGGAAVAILTRR